LIVIFQLKIWEVSVLGKMKSLIIPLLTIFMAGSINFGSANASRGVISPTQPTNTFENGYSLQWNTDSKRTTLSSVGDKITYTYNENHNRSSKTVDNQYSSFMYDDQARLVSETRDSKTFTYQYDELNAVVGSTLNDKSFKYVKNDDLDVITIMDSDGLELVKYVYENGNVTAILGQDDNGNWVDQQNNFDFIGTQNLIRLHSFYYDSETGWYYNGLSYYDSKNNKYIVNGNVSNSSYSQSSILTGEVTPFADQQMAIQISTCVNNSNNNSSFGTPKSYSSTWYSSLSDLEVLTRLLYAENTVNTADQNAVAWVVINRKLANSSTFGGNTFRGVATKSGQFEPLTGDSSGTNNARNPSTSSSLWCNALWNACTMVTTSSTTHYNDFISKPTGISTQLYFVGLSYFLLSGVSQDASPSGLKINFGSGAFVTIKDVVVVFDSTDVFQNPSSRSAITSNSRLDTSGERAKHNIFFNI
jgi:YD repeat-containing protein